MDLFSITGLSNHSQIVTHDQFIHGSLRLVVGIKIVVGENIDQSPAPSSLSQHSKTRISKSQALWRSVDILVHSLDIDKEAGCIGEQMQS